MGGKDSKTAKTDKGLNSAKQSSANVSAPVESKSPQPPPPEAKLEHKKSFVVAKFRDEKTVAGQKKRQIEDNLNATAQIQREKFQQGLDDEPILRDLIKLPEGEQLNDWLEINSIHFFNIASMVYGTLGKQCTDDSCPDMTAGAKYQYYWADGKSQEAVSVSARQYMTYMFDWIEAQISDPAIFPVDDEGQYPADFEDRVKAIFKRLFRMYAHVYYKHFEAVKAMGAESHLNSSFQHFAYFVLEYSLVPDNELRPLRKLIGKLVPGYINSS